jgi:Flp pilus assembly pilin Flp
MGKLTQIHQLAKKLWADDRGQSTTEYILILAVVVMIAVKFKSTFGNKLTSVVTNLGSQLDSATQDVGSQ